MKRARELVSAQISSSTSATTTARSTTPAAKTSGNYLDLIYDGFSTIPGTEKKKAKLVILSAEGQSKENEEEENQSQPPCYQVRQVLALAVDHLVKGDDRQALLIIEMLLQDGSIGFVVQ